MLKLDDTQAYLGTYSAVCSRCRHLKDGYTCDAFEQIPEQIWLGENDHTEPYPDDGGIQFEPAEGQGA